MQVKQVAIQVSIGLAFVTGLNCIYIAGTKRNRVGNKKGYWPSKYCWIDGLSPVEWRSQKVFIFSCCSSQTKQSNAEQDAR